MIKTFRQWLMFGFLGSLIGCAVKLPPTDRQMENPSVRHSKLGGTKSHWELDSLSPLEGTVLIDRRKTRFSIIWHGVGTYEYFISLSANNKVFRPFFVQVVAANGETSLKEKLIWQVKVKGKREDIVIGLYGVSLSNSRQTKTITLLKEIHRGYDIICDGKKCWLIRFLRTHIFCSCKV